MGLVWAARLLVLAVVLTGCQTTRPQSMAITAPGYQGVVTPIVGQVTLAVSPLNRRISFSSETINEINTNGNSKRSMVSVEGYVESFRIGLQTQITFGVSRMAENGAWQTIPSLIVQMSVDDSGKTSRFDVGGALMQQAAPEQRQQLDSFSRSLTQLAGMDRPAMPLRQGDAVFALQIADIVRAGLIPQSALEGKTIEGPGFAGRLAGETMVQGRRMYLVVLDGQMSVKDFSGHAVISFSGYTLIDAATALYASTNMLIQIRFIGSTEIKTLSQLSKADLRF